MDKLIQEMMDKITAENQIIEELSDLASEKRQVIINGDISQLNAIMRRENILVQALKVAENERFALQSKLAQEWGLPPYEVSAYEIVRRLKTTDDSDVSMFKAGIDTLAFNFNNLKKLNQMNLELLDQSLAFIETWENMLSRESDTTYSSGGTVKDTTTTIRALINRTV